MKAYLLVGLGYEYNDSTYDLTEEQVIKNKTAILDRNEAISKARSELRSLLMGDGSRWSGFRFGDFDERYKLNRNVDIFRFMVDTNRDPYHHSYDITYHEFIAWAEQNNVDWYAIVPKLYDILEIEIPD